MEARPDPERKARLTSINADASPGGQIQFVESVPFGPEMVIDRFELSNGLGVLLCPDHTAPVIAYHTWFRVGSRHEKPEIGRAHV